MPPPRLIDFTKAHGLGNDLILVDALDRPDWLTLDWPALARRWCDRHTGIGADGLLLLSPADAAHARMTVLNADGSDGGMCGNGLRCVARLLVERRGADPAAVRVASSRGTLLISCRTDPFLATVDMGQPGLDARDLPALAQQPRLIDAPPPIDLGSGVRMTCVSMGNPHAVLIGPGVAGLDPAAVGPRLETHRMFPARCNVQFVTIERRDLAIVRTWERGAGLTRACGTGACAALVAGVLTGRLDRRAGVRLPGGELDLCWDDAAGHVFMTGPAELVFTGRI
jgi:diaminopimelate epimerase